MLIRVSVTLTFHTLPVQASLTNTRPHADQGTRINKKLMQTRFLTQQRSIHLQCKLHTAGILLSSVISIIYNVIGFMKFN